MRETRLSGSERGAEHTNASFLPLSQKRANLRSNKNLSKPMSSGIAGMMSFGEICSLEKEK